MIGRGEATVLAVAVLVASVAALVLGVVFARRAVPRSSTFIMSVAGAVLGGLFLLQALLVIVVLLAGWDELR